MPRERALPAPGHLHRQHPPRLAHELHLPPLNPLLLGPRHRHDHQPRQQKDEQSRRQPQRLPPRPRLYVPPSPHPPTPPQTNHPPPLTGVSHRPTTSTAARRLSAGTATSPPPDSSLAALLFNLNSSAVSSISATINGEARLVAAGSDEERFYRAKHLEANTFDAGADLLRRESVVGGGGGAEDGGRGCFVAGEEVRVIVVAIRDVRIADWKGAVRDWVIAPVAAAEEAHQGVNGVR